MNAIFLCENSNNIFRVFNNQIVSELKSKVEIEEKVYAKSDIIKAPCLFKDVEFIFSTWGMPTFTKEEIKTLLPSLKCIFYGAGSVQTFAHSFLESGVKVFSAWAANAVPVAEMTVAQIILANKGYFVTNRLYHTEGRQSAAIAFNKCNGNYLETVGIIGAGMIGRLVIQMLKQYKLNVIVYDPFLSEEKASELGVKKCELNELFKNAFVVSNHLANNEQTKGMLNYDLFKLMRENAVFINTGRGAQVVEDDLVKILRERYDLTALLDVTDPEPPINEHPFYSLPNCILTPHIAGSAGYELVRMGEYMLIELNHFINNEPTKFEINSKMLDTMA